jgi:hypothetical protein
MMLSCSEMKKGQVYRCKECGLELQVVKECKDCGKPASDCGCQPKTSRCAFSCCGKDLAIKS